MSITKEMKTNLCDAGASFLALLVHLSPYHLELCNLVGLHLLMISRHWKNT